MTVVPNIEGKHQSIKKRLLVIVIAISIFKIIIMKNSRKYFFINSFAKLF